MIYGGFFDVDQKRDEIFTLEEELINPNIWDNKEKAEHLIERLNSLKDATSDVIDLHNTISDCIDIIKLIESDGYDEDNLLPSLENDLI